MEFVYSPLVDTGLVLTVNLVNLLLVGIFVSRPAGLKRLESLLGLLVVAMALPTTGAVVVNMLAGRALWTVLLPVPLVIFCLVELAWDYVAKVDFRHTRLLWPYLALYYAALAAMIGYAFGVHVFLGFITLGTYFLQLLATWYSYSRVGHGRERSAAS